MVLERELRILQKLFLVETFMKVKGKDKTNFFEKMSHSAEIYRRSFQQLLGIFLSLFGI